MSTLHPLTPSTRAGTDQHRSPGTRSRPGVVVIGGGQLARMLHAAAIPLDLDVRYLVSRPDDPVTKVAPRWVVAHPSERAEIAALARGCGAVTVEHEQVDLDVLRWLAERGLDVHPGAEALAACVDKGTQRRRLAAMGAPLPPWWLVHTVSEVVEVAEAVGWPVVVKHCRGGYDGRGVTVVDGQPAAAEVVLGDGTQFLVEPLLDLQAELAVTVARDAAGRRVTYPPVATVQHEGICTEVVLPADEHLPLDDAVALAGQIAEELGVVGVLTVELFVVDGRVVVNELAARPHNSAHLTIEACTTSQFENHLRAVAGLPLGSTAPRRPAAAMANVLGPSDPVDLHDRLPDVLSLPDVHVHLYGKDVRPGRKVGHVTALADDRPTALARVRRAAELLTRPEASR